MPPPNYGQTMRFGPPLTPVVRMLLIVHGSIFLLVGVVLEALVSREAALWIYLHFGLVPVGFFESFQYWQLLTYSFLHSDLGHVFWNLVTIWMFGCEVEGRWGKRPFLFFYLLCAAGGGLAMVLVEGNPTIGASGAGIGLVVAYGILFAERQIFLLFPPVSVKAKWLAVGWIAIDLIYFLKGQGGGVAYFAHFGGAATAYLYLKLFRRFPWPIRFRGLSLAEHWTRYRTRRYLKIVTDRHKGEERKGPTLH